MIRFEGVTKRYADGVTAVDDLTLEVPKGGITVFVGPSGCGKTTSLRMINRMVEPTEGRILINDQDVADRKPAQLRRSIGYVIQHAGLFPHRTVLKNVMTVPKLIGWDAGRARSAAMEAIEKVGLTANQAERYPAQLSGGQQQRVGVARALASDPEVVLMDEPFSAVDPLVRMDLQAEVKRLQRELGITVVLVTHDIDEAIVLGDHVAVLRQGGKLAQLASPGELLREPADDFVASFVGKDRGYRKLGFTGTHLEPSPEQTVSLGEDVPEGRGWVLAVGEGGEPLGWVDRHTSGGPVERDELHRMGALAEVGDSARVFLDAALSAPSRRGVVVSEGRVVGTVSAQQVVDSLEQV
ncbi:L-proline glycine betaine ABC transport system permease protein ProV [Serinicoccus hydrothermalis]|uniref:ABC-type quaternary amine transporter n=1 Tax=Serinicoccus hydrothermalis TaxID=1758689 RepID=A0A1B1NCE7_9MICO|nr:ATP-binding cassette domain-containing protein [Serinicoccus hydrothermalis]ANS79130.1 L-proline glycine betaine ABC transport system permease protein ProV [Serinicoccus hydrothermalis]